MARYRAVGQPLPRAIRRPRGGGTPVLILLLALSACGSSGRSAPGSPPELATGHEVAGVDDGSLTPDAADAAGSWHAVDHRALAEALTTPAFELPAGTSVYGARVIEGQTGLIYQEFDAGGGALDSGFWPASTVKVAAAVGALQFLAQFGFTGAADVIVDGLPYNVRQLAEEAIRDSSNEAYDLLLQIAGLDWLNNEFLSPANGFPVTVIQRSYTGWGVRWSPAMTVVEGDRKLELEPRESTADFGCPDEGNCSNLIELTDMIRRIVFADRISEPERFGVSADDIPPLRDALLAADGFIEAGAAAVLGDGTLVYNKPGETPEHQCVDVAVIDHPASQHHYLLGLSTPSDGGDCTSLSVLAGLTLQFLSHPAS